MQKFSALVKIIDINPYVSLPDDILKQLLVDAGKEKSPIPVKGMLQHAPFIQTLVKFRGEWRLYLNTPMRQASKTNVGDNVTVKLGFDPKPRIVPMPELFLQALENNKQAKEAFEKLPAYRRKEITRYLSNLKSKEALEHNIDSTIQFLLGKKIPGVLYR